MNVSRIDDESRSFTCIGPTSPSGAEDRGSMSSRDTRAILRIGCTTNGVKVSVAGRTSDSGESIEVVVERQSRTAPL